MEGVQYKMTIFCRHKTQATIVVLLIMTSWTTAILGQPGTENLEDSSLNQRVLNDSQWREDLAQMVQAIRDIHFKPFVNVTESDFKAATDALSSSIPKKTDKEIVVAMAQLVASLHDGHTRLHFPRQYPDKALEAEKGHSGTLPPHIESLKFQQLPVQFDDFQDGVFITAAEPRLRHLIGRRVTHVSDTEIEEVLEQLKTTCFYENDQRARLLATDRLALPEVLAALDIIDHEENYSIRTIGHSDTASTPPQTKPVAHNDNAAMPQTTRLSPLNGGAGSFIDGAPEPLPIWLGRSQESQWYEVLPSSDAVYVQVNRFEEAPQRPYNEFVAETVTAAGTAGVQRYILDLRHNTGGIGAWTLPFSTGLGRSQFNQYGRLYVLMGRTTYSAAQHLLHQLEAYSYAIFVGEPGGASPSHFSDPRKVVLDHSGLTLRVSTLYWHSWLANDFREAINPHIDAPFYSVDYFDGRDPALQAAITFVPAGTIAGQIDQQLRAGKIQNGLLLFQRYLTDGTFSSFRNEVPDLMSKADALLDDGFTRPGRFLFMMLNQAWPGNPQVEAGLLRAQAMEVKAQTQK